MLTRYRHLTQNCLPFLIAEADSATGFRLGGNPPAGVVPSFQAPSTRYFLTLPLDDGLELSIFMSFVLENGPLNVPSRSFHLLGTDSNLMEFLIHPAAPRAETSPFRSEIPSHGINVQPETPDLQEGFDPADEDPDSVLEDHKIGGRPAYYQSVDPMFTDAPRAMNEGYFHLLQVDFPGYHDALLSVDWPFGQYIFHLFAKESGGSVDFKFGWM